MRAPHSPMWRMTEKGPGLPGVGLMLDFYSRCAGSVFRYIDLGDNWIAVQDA